MPEQTKTPIRTLGILTGGGDVPGLNAAIKALVYRAETMGIRSDRFARRLGGHYLSRPGAGTRRAVFRRTTRTPGKALSDAAGPPQHAHD